MLCGSPKKTIEEVAEGKGSVEISMTEITPQRESTLAGPPLSMPSHPRLNAPSAGSDLPLPFPPPRHGLEEEAGLSGYMR